MQQALLKGIILGLTLAALVGPVFFALLQISLQRGYFSGFLLAIGITLSDSIYIFLTNYFLSFIKNLQSVEYFLGIFGGFILVIIGIMTTLKRPQPTEENEENTVNNKSHRKSLGIILRGFLMNFAHPGVLIFWIGVITLINTNWDYDTDQKVTLYTATIATVFITDNLKAFLAHQIKDLLTFKLLLWMNRVMGLILIAFGMQLFLRTLFF